jgi:hypothetical protein
VATKRLNRMEIALAARFVATLDNDGSSDLVDPAYLTEARIFVRLRGEGKAAAEASRLASELEGRRLLGLPIRVVSDASDAVAPAPALLLDVKLAADNTGRSLGRVAVSSLTADGSRPVLLGIPALQADATAADLGGSALAQAIDRSVAGAFVRVKPARRTVGSTTVRIENRLPFTLARVVLRTGTDPKSGAIVALSGLGVGPLRSTEVPIQAATGTVERVEFNGL